MSPRSRSKSRSHRDLFVSPYSVQFVYTLYVRAHTRYQLPRGHAFFALDIPRASHRHRRACGSMCVGGGSTRGAHHAPGASQRTSA